MRSKARGSFAAAVVVAAAVALVASAGADGVVRTPGPTPTTPGAVRSTKTIAPRTAKGTAARRASTTPLPAPTRSAAAHRSSSARRRTVRAQTSTISTTGAGRYGIASGALLFSAPDASFNVDMDTIKGFGARWLRTPLKWQNAEIRGKGIFNWRASDRLVNGATSRGLALVLTVTSTPAWALPPEAKGNPSYPPVNVSDYADFLGAAVARYRDRVHVWELGNEPNHAAGWMPKPEPARYAQLLKLTYHAIKVADPTAIVLTGGLGGVRADPTHIPGDTFVSLLYQYGAGPSFDAVSYHPYTYPYSPYETPPKRIDRSWAHMLSARQIMVNNGDSLKQIWATEYGAPTNGPRPRNFVSESRQALLLRDAYQLFSSYSWAGPMMWFQHRDNGSDPRVQDDWFGLLRGDRTEKPAAAAYRAGVAAAGG